MSVASADLARRATRGTLWTVLGFAVAQMLRLGGNLIVTRLLFEEAFGLMSLVLVVQQGLTLFSDIGIGPSIIQSNRDDKDFLNTTFTIQAIRGCVLTVAGCLLAYPVSVYYEQPALATLLPFVSLSALIAGFNSTRIFSLNRELALGQLQLVSIGSQFAGLVVMVTWAYLAPSVWALAGGAIVATLSTAVLSHVCLPGIRNRFRWDAEAARSQIRFGRWIFVSTVLTFVCGFADRLVFGKLFPLGALGVYSIGAMLAALPVTGVSLVSQDVVFPVYGKLFQRDGSLARTFNSTRRPILLLAGWAFSGLIAGGESAVRLLYDDRYHDAGRVVQILSLGGWFLILATTHGSALLAMGKPQWTSASSLAKMIGMIAFIPVGLLAGRHLDPNLAFQGAVAGFALAEIPRFAVTSFGARRHGLQTLRTDAAMTMLVVTVGALVGLCASVQASGGLPVVTECIAIAVAVTLLWLPFAHEELKKLLVSGNFR